MPTAYLTRIESFCASHRLHNVHLSDEDNRNIFGKCNNPNGHGHNYKVEVTVKGPIDKVTGMVINLTDLKAIITETVMNTMDHKNLDLDVPYFSNVVSTAENICVFIWDMIAQELPEDVYLHEIKLHETEKNVVFYRGEEFV